MTSTEHSYASTASSLKVKEKKSSTYCCVPQCRNYAGNGMSFHLFPKDPKLRAIWKRALNMGKVIKDTDRVCKEHFLPSDYIPQATPGIRHLKKIAVPSQKLPFTY